MSWKQLQSLFQIHIINYLASRITKKDLFGAYTLPIDHLIEGRFIESLRAATDGYFDIQGIRYNASFPPFDHAIRLSGRFLTDTEQAYDVISERAKTAGFLIFFPYPSHRIPSDSSAL